MRIIDHKRIDLTDDEYKMYQELLQSYDQRIKPETLFHDLFETNQEGIIIYLKPPKQNRFTMEVFLFLMSVMQHQHLRQMYKKVDEAIQQMRDSVKEIESNLKEKEIVEPKQSMVIVLFILISQKENNG